MICPTLTEAPSAKKYVKLHIQKSFQNLPFPNLIPRRLPAESLPLVVEPPPKLVAHLRGIKQNSESLNNAEFLVIIILRQAI